MVRLNMNAEEARTITYLSCDKTVEKVLAMILFKIKEAASDGKFDITDWRILNKLEKHEEKILIQELEKLGYKVTVRTYTGDYWGDSGSTTLTISWR